MARLEDLLGETRYLAGDRVTEADWRLFPTLVRFDAVYHGHFKCNRARIVDYPNLWGYTRDLYQWPGIAATVNLDHARRHYHYSHETINPHRIVPVGPKLDFTAPPGRAPWRRKRGQNTPYWNQRTINSRNASDSGSAPQGVHA